MFASKIQVQEGDIGKLPITTFGGNGGIICEIIYLLWKELRVRVNIGIRDGKYQA